MVRVQSAPPVSLTILEQLGGRRFILMTGAKDFVGSDTALTFKLPTKGVDGSNKVRITLTAMDDYIVETFFVRGCKFAPKSYREGVYCDTLRAVFESLTGLRTSL